MSFATNVKILDKQTQTVEVEGQQYTIETFRRTGGWGEDDYGYKIKEIDVDGFGQKSREEAYRDAMDALRRRHQ